MAVPIQIIQATIDFIITIPFFGLGIAKRWFHLLCWILIGLFLIVVRWFALSEAIVLDHHVKGVTRAIDDASYMLDAVLTVAANGFVIVAGAAHYIIDAVNKVSNYLGYGSIDNIPLMHLPGLVSVGTVSTTEIQHDLSFFITVCPAYNDAYKIILWILRRYLGPYTCAVVRAGYPVWWIYDAAEGVLSWTYPGSAYPKVDIPEYNCDDTSENVYFSCVGTSIGLFIIEILLPYFILEIFFSVCGGALLYLLWSILKTSWRILLLPFTLVHEFVLFNKL